MVIAGLILSVSLAWNYYETRKTSNFEEETYTAELLAHGLSREAASSIEESIRKEPVSPRSIKLRRVLADIYMNDLNDYEKALSELIFVKTFNPELASSTEKNIRYCMTRLGHVYDVERRKMHDLGINPIKNEVSSSTVIRIANKPVCSVDNLKQKIKEFGIPKDKINEKLLIALANRISQEILLNRAADRSGIKETSGYLKQVKQFEKNLALQNYLEKYCFKDINITDEDVANYISKNKNMFEKEAQVTYSVFQFENAARAEDYILQNSKGESGVTLSIANASEPIKVKIEPDIVLQQNQTANISNLPDTIRGLSVEKLKNTKYYGPVKVENKWNVYEINNVIDSQKMDPERAKMIATQQLTENKKHELLAKKISELKEKEGLVINKDVIKSAFFKKATDTKQLPKK